LRDPGWTSSLSDWPRLSGAVIFSAKAHFLGSILPVDRMASAS
jgi:hypothetical protein